MLDASEVRRDGDGVTGAGMGARQNVTAEDGVAFQRRPVQRCRVGRPLHVALLTHVVAPTAHTLDPPQERVARRLHQSLTGHDALAMVRAGVGPGTSVAVVGDGAVGLCAVLAAVQLGAPSVIAMSRHEARQRVAREFGATHVVAERGDAGASAVHELTGGIGADCVLECVGTEDARLQAVACVRDGGNIGLVGVPHGELPLDQLFWRNVGVKGGPAHCRAYLPHLLDLVLDRTIDPGVVFDLELPLSEVAEAYAAMDSRRAIKSLVRP